MDENTNTENNDAAEAKRIARVRVDLAQLDAEEAMSIAYAQADEALAGYPTAALLGEVASRSVGRNFAEGTYKSGGAYRTLDVDVEL